LSSRRHRPGHLLSYTPAGGRDGRTGLRPWLHRQPHRVGRPAGGPAAAPCGGWLEDLRSRGLASESEGRYRYTPASEELDRIVDDLAESYAKYRVAVIGLIFARPSERITSFADAFRIRRKH
jgi:hypothetical protein